MEYRNATEFENLLRFGNISQLISRILGLFGDLGPLALSLLLCRLAWGRARSDLAQLSGFNDV